MSVHVRTVEDLFKAFGGSAAMARALGVNASTCSEMKRRASIPLKWWPQLVATERGMEIGLSLETLARLNLASEPGDREGAAA